MRLSHTAGLFVLLAVILSACSGGSKEAPADAHPAVSDKPPVSAETEPPVTQQQEPSPAPPRPQETKQPVAVSYRVYTGPLGFRLPDTMRELSVGETAVMGLEPFDLDVLLPGLKEEPARKALSIEGLTLIGDPVWLSEGGLALQIGKGATGQTGTINIRVDGQTPAALEIRRVGPATVTIDQRIGHTWQAVTVLNAYTSPGPSAVRINFSKPVRKDEVESALLAAQSKPIRGLMEWTDDQTLTWQIADLPPRLDFLLGGAHDADGLPLPGGIPSLRLGDPPAAVLVDLADLEEKVLGTLPPDIVTAELSRSRQAINLIAWIPGTTKWDWRTVDLYFDLEKKGLKTGRVEEVVPRLPDGLENWVVSPNGSLVASLRSSGVETESFQADLVVTDLRGGRSQVFPNAIGRYRGAGQVDLTTYLAWSPDSLAVAALSYAGHPETSELIMVDVSTGERTVLVPDLPVRSDGTRLTWSGDGRFLLAGNMLINQEERAAVPLPGDTAAGGFWEPGGARLIYSPRDWGPTFLVNPETAEAEPLGDGMAVGWVGTGKAVLVRWNGSETRYLPPGQ